MVPFLKIFKAIGFVKLVKGQGLIQFTYYKYNTINIISTPSLKAAEAKSEFIQNYYFINFPMN